MWKKNKNQNNQETPPPPPRKSPLSEDSAIAETPPFFVHNRMCLSIKAVDNSKPFALVKMLMKIMMCG